MAKHPDGAERDPMAHEVDRLLRELDPPEQRKRRMAAKPRPPRTPPPPQITITLPSPLGVWLRVILGTVLAAAMTQWPYPLCGLPLAGYFAALAVVMIAGGWAGYASWRRRMGLAHIVAIGLVFTGLSLAALQVLPRIGYGPVAMAWPCP